MPENGDMRVDSVWRDNHPTDHNQIIRSGERDSGGGENRRQKKKSKDYFTALAKRAEVKNNELTRKQLPYRFCVYQEKGDIFIDAVTIDSNGRIIKKIRRNITNEDFDKIIDDMSLLEGLFLDTNA